MGWRGHQRWAKDKSRWVLKNLGNFFSNEHKNSIFVNERLRKTRSNMSTPPLKKWHYMGLHCIFILWLCNFMKILIDNLIMITNVQSDPIRWIGKERHVWPCFLKIGEFCAHWKGIFLDFLKLNLLSSLSNANAIFLEHPVQYQDCTVVYNC